LLQKNGELEEKIGEYKKAFKGIDNEKIKLLDETEANKNLMHIIDKLIDSKQAGEKDDDSD
jgi:hypothetical protein